MPETTTTKIKPHPRYTHFSSFPAPAVFSSASLSAEPRAPRPATPKSVTGRDSGTVLHLVAKEDNTTLNDIYENTLKAWEEKAIRASIFAEELLIRHILRALPYHDIASVTIEENITDEGAEGRILHIVNRENAIIICGGTEEWENFANVRRINLLAADIYELVPHLFFNSPQTGTKTHIVPVSRENRTPR